jgi:hypothetical protein
MAWLIGGALAFAPAVTIAADYGIEQVGWRPLFRGRSSGCADCQSCPSCEHAAPSGQPPSMEPTPMEPTPGMPPSEQPSPTDTADLPSFGSLAMAEQGMGGGAGTMILGRADALNRFNLFDNMGAEPVTRAWFAFQAAEGLNTNVVGNPALGRPNQNIYRFGFEYAFSDMSSFAFQAGYNTTHDTGTGIGALEDSWSNPQIMFKRVLFRRDVSTVAATVGFVPETSTEASTINESFSRVQPGVILFRELSDDCFLHGGGELNIPLEDNATMSVDWVLSLGRWLYRHESLDGYDTDYLPWIVGVTGQVEALGKHVTGDSTIAGGFFVEQTISSPNGGPSSTIIRTFDFEEARHVVDMTIGTNILFSNETALGLGYSFPVTGNEVRRGEVIISYNVFF